MFLSDPVLIGLTTNATYKLLKKTGDSQKKIVKISKELERLQSVVSTLGYQMKAKEPVKIKHLEQVIDSNYMILIIY